MPKATAEVETEYRHKDGTWAPFRLKEVKEETVKFRYKSTSAAVKSGSKKTGDDGSFVKWRWVFECIGGEYQGDSFNVDTDPKVTTRADSKARIISEVFLGEAIQVGQGVDTDNFEGMTLQALITNMPPVTKKNGDMGWYSDLTDFAPMGQDMGGAAPSSGSTFDSEPPF